MSWPVALLAALALVLVTAPAAEAGFGATGEFKFTRSIDKPGEFGNLNAVGVNFAVSGGAAAGDVYAQDGGNGFSTGGRIQQFSQAGDFKRLWGTNVVASGPGNADEVQMVRVQATAGSLYRVTFGGRESPQ